MRRKTSGKLGLCRWCQLRRNLRSSKSIFSCQTVLHLYLMATPSSRSIPPRRSSNKAFYKSCKTTPSTLRPGQYLMAVKTLTLLCRSRYLFCSTTTGTPSRFLKKVEKYLLKKRYLKTAKMTIYKNKFGCNRSSSSCQQNPKPYKKRTRLLRLQARSDYSYLLSI